MTHTSYSLDLVCVCAYLPSSLDIFLSWMYTRNTCMPSLSHRLSKFQKEIPRDSYSSKEVTQVLRMQQHVF